MGILTNELNRIHHGMAKIAAKYFGEGNKMADFIDRQATMNAVGLTTDTIKINPIYVDAQGNELVAVVRCKDCCYAGECHKSVQYARNEPNTVTIGYSPIEWCSKGERREDETN